MTKVVDAFVVGHWAVSRKLTNRHVNRPTTNAIEDSTEGKYHGADVYNSLIGTFSQEDDLILDIGSKNGNFS